MERFQPPLKAPPLPVNNWLNAIEPVSGELWSDKITLIEFFDFTCINCIRTLPYLRAWHERYESLGFRLLGIHTPEFSFGHDPAAVTVGIHRLGVRWPVLLDNHQALWTAYANRYWPTHYLIDQFGKIRFRHVGEGGYTEIELQIQDMLRSLDPMVHLPDPLQPIRPEDGPDAICAPTSPESQLGSVEEVRLGNPDPATFTLPDELKPDRIFLEGIWRITQDGLTLTGKQGEIALIYTAARVHCVLSPYPDDTERLPFDGEPLYIQVLQDGVPLDRSCFGEDILADGLDARFRVEYPRLYNLVENPRVETHELILKITQPGLTFYAFSFGSCLTERSPRYKE